MAENIFASAISDEVQHVHNRYELCQGLFDRARQINRSGTPEAADTRPNPTAQALSDYAGVTDAEEAAAQEASSEE